MLTCKFCNKEFKIKGNLDRHIKTNKKCLIIQNEIKIQRDLEVQEEIRVNEEGKKENKSKQKIDDDILSCKHCKVTFTRNDNLKRHIKICSVKIIEDLEKQLEDKDKQIEKQLEDKDKQIEKLEKQLEKQLDDKDKQIEKLALAGINRPTTTKNTTNNINQTQNIIFEKLNVLDLKKFDSFLDCICPSLIHKGADGLANYSMNGPLSSCIICTDPSRNKFGYKNASGELMIDYNLYKIQMYLGKSILNKYIEEVEKMQRKFEDKKDKTNDEKDIKFFENKIEMIDNYMISVSQMSRGMKMDEKFQKNFIRMSKKIIIEQNNRLKS